MYNFSIRVIIIKWAICIIAQISFSECLRRHRKGRRRIGIHSLENSSSGGPPLQAGKRRGAVPIHLLICGAGSFPIHGHPNIDRSFARLQEATLVTVNIGTQTTQKVGSPVPLLTNLGKPASCNLFTSPTRHSLPLARKRSAPRLWKARRARQSRTPVKNPGRSHYDGTKYKSHATPAGKGSPAPRRRVRTPFPRLFGVPCGVTPRKGTPEDGETEWILIGCRYKRST